MKKTSFLLSFILMGLVSLAQTSTGTISGKISLGTSSLPAYPAQVYIIQERFVDTVNATGDTVRDILLTVIDSLNTDTGGHYATTITASTSPDRQIIVKAALLSTSSSYGSYLPTYYYDPLSSGGPALTWDQASWIAQPLPSSTTVDIALPAGTLTSGPGFISGSVFMGAGKHTSPLSLPGKILILTDNSNAPISYTYSDASGNFNFPNLPVGSYKLFGDAGGKENPFLPIDITTSSYLINNIVFEENSTAFKGHFTPASVNAVAPNMANISVFPNPAKDLINIAGTDKIKGVKDIVVTNIAGTHIYSRSYLANETISIPCAQWPNGTYLLQINTTEGKTNYKITK